MVFNNEYKVYVNKDGLVFRIDGNFRKQTVHLVNVTYRDNHGYQRITSKKKRVLVHRLVWETFNGKIPVGMQINHIDGDKQNNSLSNLELVTPSENMKHAYDNGLAKPWNSGFKNAQEPWNKGIYGEDYKKHYKKGFKNQYNGGM